MTIRRWRRYVILTTNLLAGTDPKSGEAADRDLRSLAFERWQRQPLRGAWLRIRNVTRLIDQPERQFGIIASLVAWGGWPLPGSQPDAVREELHAR